MIEDYPHTIEWFAVAKSSWNWHPAKDRESLEYRASGPQQCRKRKRATSPQKPLLTAQSREKAIARKSKKQETLSGIADWQLPQLFSMGKNHCDSGARPS
jgi:hypothetical protein